MDVPRVEHTQIHFLDILGTQGMMVSFLLWNRSRDVTKKCGAVETGPTMLDSTTVQHSSAEYVHKFNDDDDDNSDLIATFFYHVTRFEVSVYWKILLLIKRTRGPYALFV